MAIDAFLKFEGPECKGDSVGEGHAGEIDLLAYSWGMSQSGTMHQATGGGAGKVNVQDLSFTHYVDSASVNLVKYCCTGQHIDKVTLVLQKAGGKALPYLTLVMESVIVTSVSAGASSGEDRQTENVTLNFAKFKLSYQPQDAKGGKKGGAIEAQYDIAKNV
ncbi:MAG TPA: type VI secretion system tube protein Hcp [Gammaproteobacteria bacterium]